MPTDRPPPPPLVVVCLCADWCGVCRGYRASFDTVAAALPVRAQWVDVEDDADMAGELDVTDFPTLVIGRDREPLFVGPLTPQPAVLQHLLERALAGGLAPLPDAAAAAALLERLNDRTNG